MEENVETDSRVADVHSSTETEHFRSCARFILIKVDKSFLLKVSKSFQAINLQFCALFLLFVVRDGDGEENKELFSHLMCGMD